jgi:hypothetical protein
MTSGVGTKPTSDDVPNWSAFGVKADMALNSADVRQADTKLNVQIGLTLSVRTSPSSRRGPERLLEGTRKRGLGIVANGFSDLCKRCAGGAEFFGRDLHAPTGEVVHWRHADQTDEI